MKTGFSWQSPSLPPRQAPPPSFQAIPTPADPPESRLDHFKTSANFVAGGSVFKFRKFVAEAWQGHFGLKDEPKVKMERPVVLVPGFTTPMDPYWPLVDHLTQDGANGGKPYFVQGGQIFSDSECTHKVSQAQDPSARVFVIAPYTRYDTPPVFADQLKAGVEAIQRFTGAPKSDAIGYSMGGISTRLFLDQGGQGVGKFLSVGTPHQGSRAGSLARWAVKNDINWAMSLAGHAAAALAPLDWLRALGEGAGKNPNLERLNQRWPEQSASLEGALSVGADSHMTPCFNAWGWSRGDTGVEKTSLSVPGLETHIVRGGMTKSHETLMGDPDIFREMRGFLNWKEV